MKIIHTGLTFYLFMVLLNLLVLMIGYKLLKDKMAIYSMLI